MSNNLANHRKKILYYLSELALSGPKPLFALQNIFCYNSFAVQTVFICESEREVRTYLRLGPQGTKSCLPFRMQHVIRYSRARRDKERCSEEDEAFRHG